MIKNKIEHWKVIAFYLMIFDICAVWCAYFAGLLIRFDFQYSAIQEHYLEPFKHFIPIYAVLVVIVYEVLHLYRSLWRFASYNELNRILLGNVICTILHIAGITVFFGKMPVSYFMCGAVLQMLFTVGIRFSYRYITLIRSRRESNSKVVHRAMVIGAGNAGQTIIREIRNSVETDLKVCCVIDDNRNKWNRYLDGIPIVGGRDSILENVEKYQIDRILFAIPTIDMKQRREILNICKETSCEVKTLPGVYQLVNGQVTVSQMKKVSVEDLLGRDAVKVDLEVILEQIQGKRILVTGGGGSIGSELCRQIASHDPEQLIIFDIYENNAYEIEQELKRKYPDLNLVTLIGSVRDTGRIRMVFEEYKPHIVYHAAAHKHVPLMEGSPNESIKNNVFGTYKTAYAALMNGTEKFVLISTDKAVNPTNIMGASKRLCEMVIQCMNAISMSGAYDRLPDISYHREQADQHTVENPVNRKPGCQFVAVRFGNVLGSNGSVVPLFQKQIAAGGPVTVTHPDIIRYFMTIPEAVSLVLQAGVYAKGGEIFVLDMGEPVKIDTLARNLIRLSGFVPDKDIKIVYSGLRPGEKLYEEKLMAEEGIRTTCNDLIYVAKPITIHVDAFMEKLESLMKACYRNQKDIRKLVEEMVDTYHPL